MDDCAAMILSSPQAQKSLKSCLYVQENTCLVIVSLFLCRCFSVLGYFLGLSGYYGRLLVRLYKVISVSTMSSTKTRTQTIPQNRMTWLLPKTLCHSYLQCSIIQERIFSLNSVKKRKEIHYYRIGRFFPHQPF